MTSSRDTSPDKYIGLRKNVPRFLTREEKLMVLNVYGILRKEVRLSVTAAVTRTASLCGVSGRAVYSARQELEDNGEITTPSRSVHDIAFEDSDNQVSGRNYNPELHFMVKAKILKMLKKNDTTTVKSVVEAFRKDPNLPNLGNTTIGNVIKQLNMTSCLSKPVPVELHQQCNQHTLVTEVDLEDGCSNETITAVSSIISSAQQDADSNSVGSVNNVVVQQMEFHNLEANEDCNVDYSETNMHASSGMVDAIKFHDISVDESGSVNFVEASANSASPPEVILPDFEGKNFGSNTYYVPKVKMEVADNAASHDVISTSGMKVEGSVMVVIKSEIDKGPDLSMVGIFPNTPSELATRTSENGDSNKGDVFRHAPPEITSGMCENSDPTLSMTYPITSNGPTSRKVGDSNSDGIFTTAPSELTVGIADNSYSGINSYTFSTSAQQIDSLTSLSNHPLPLTGILVYGTILPNGSSSFSLETGADGSKNVHYNSSVTMEEDSNSVGIFPNTPPELASEATESFGSAYTFPISVQPIESPSSPNKECDPLSIGIYEPTVPNKSNSLPQDDSSEGSGEVHGNEQYQCGSSAPSDSRCDRSKQYKFDCPCCKGSKAIVHITDGGHCEYLTPLKVTPPNEPSQNVPQASNHDPKHIKFSCNFCQRTFKREGPLSRHLKTAHLNPRTPRPYTHPWTCRYCGEVFSGCKGRDLIQHVMYLHTMKSLKCDFCESTFQSAQRLVRHVVNIHSDSFLKQQGLFQA